MTDLRDVLDWLEIDFTGWELVVVAGNSADGNTIVGIGQYQKAARGFVLELPHAGNCRHASLQGQGQH